MICFRPLKCLMHVQNAIDQPELHERSKSIPYQGHQAEVSFTIRLLQVLNRLNVPEMQSKEYSSCESGFVYAYLRIPACHCASEKLFHCKHHLIFLNFFHSVLFFPLI